MAILKQPIFSFGKSFGENDRLGDEVVLDGVLVGVVGGKGKPSLPITSLSGSTLFEFSPPNHLTK